MVAELGEYNSYGVVSGISVDRLRFVPEQDRALTVTDNWGGSFTWNGAGTGALTLPNGYYRIVVQSAGGTEQEAEVYLEHGAWNGGNIVVSLLPRQPFARIRWSYNEPVQLRFDSYNLAGELVWTNRGEGPNGELQWELSAGSRQGIANGIYLLKAHVSTLDGALDEVRIFKLAVVR